MGDSLLNKSGGYVSSQRNPWLNDCIGSRRTILQLAEDTGLLQKVSFVPLVLYCSPTVRLSTHNIHLCRSQSLSTDST